MSDGEMEIHFERGHEDAPRLLCEDCGEPVLITGEGGLRTFEPVGCGCDVDHYEYRFAFDDEGDSQ